MWGLQKAMLFFGIAFLLVVCGLSMFLVNPPAGYVPQSAKPKEGKPAAPPKPGDRRKTFRDDEKGSFYIIWLIFFIGAGAGLMVIGSVAGMAQRSMGELAFVAVAILAVGNAGGRIIAGMISDRIGTPSHADDYPSRPGGAHADCRSSGGISEIEPRDHRAPGDFAWVQLRRQPLHFPLPHQGQLGVEELRNQLRARVFGVGRGRFRHGAAVTNARCKDGLLHLLLPDSRRSLVIGAGLALALKKQGEPAVHSS
jgi:hypothetical protein